jgi:drug/metabolite transporter (DMT)-like permease
MTDDKSAHPEEILPRESGAVWATVLGALAILFWSGSGAVTRSLSVQLGPISAGAYIYLLGGMLGAAWVLVSPRRTRDLRRLGWRYTFLCGGLFVLYIVCYQIAVGTAASHHQMLEALIVNYLWPSLMLATAPLILGMRARWPLALGVALAFAGTVLAVQPGGELSWTGFIRRVGENALPYGLMLVAAISWALYSNLSRRWSGEATGGAVPFFFLASGLLLTVLRRYGPPDVPQWTPRAVIELGCAALFPGILAYSFWDLAMRKGKLVLVASLSYFTPVLAAALTMLYLGLPIGDSPRIWLACGMVTVAALICKWSVVEPASPAPKASDRPDSPAARTDGS